MKKVLVDLKSWFGGNPTTMRFSPEEREDLFEMPMMLGVEIVFKTDSPQPKHLLVVYVFPFNPIVAGGELDVISLTFDKKGLWDLKIDGNAIPLDAIEGIRIVVHTSTAVYVLRKSIATSAAWESPIWKKRTSTALACAYYEIKNMVVRFRQLGTVPTKEE